MRTSCTAAKRSKFRGLGHHRDYKLPGLQNTLLLRMAMREQLMILHNCYASSHTSVQPMNRQCAEALSQGYDAVPVHTIIARFSPMHMALEGCVVTQTVTTTVPSVATDAYTMPASIPIAASSHGIMHSYASNRLQPNTVGMSPQPYRTVTACASNHAPNGLWLRPRSKDMRCAPALWNSTYIKRVGSSETQDGGLNNAGMTLCTSPA